MTRSATRPTANRARPRAPRVFRALVRAQARGDATLAQHGWDVGWLAFTAARRAGIPRTARGALFRAGVLHDLGKLWVDSRVLYKPAKLDAGEWEQVKRHVRYGADALSAVGLDAEAFIALGHHERPDERGYPLGLGPAELATPGCVLAAADAFCAMVEARGYAAAMPESAALDELEAGIGSQFAPDAVAAVVETVRAREDKPLGRGAQRQRKRSAQ